MSRLAPALGGVLRRAGAAAVTVAGLALAAFAALVAAPGEPVPHTEDAAYAVDPAWIEQWKREYRLAGGPVERFSAWAGGALRGDLGRSFRSGRPVAEEILERLPATLELNAAALLLVAAFGLPLGWSLAAPGPASAARARAAEAALLALYAAPVFWIALVLQDTFALRWQLLPIFGRTAPGGDAGAGERLRHLALPAACLALHGLAFYARLARETAAAGWHSRHALAARCLGVRARTAFAHHALRPSLVPLAALAGLLVPSLVAGSVVVEAIFAWPGVGVLFLDSVLARDVPLVLALTVLTGALTVAGSLFADALLAWADPRLRRRA